MRFVLFCCLIAITGYGCDTESDSGTDTAAPQIAMPDDEPMQMPEVNSPNNSQRPTPVEDMPEEMSMNDGNEPEETTPSEEGNEDSEQTDSDGETTMNEDMEEEPQVVEVDTLIVRIARATCRGLDTCCQGNEIESYWRSIANNPRFEEVADMLPPNIDYNPETCVEQLTTAFDIAPFGGWVEAVRTGVVQYNADAADSCLESLENAACGEELNLALFDGTCFAFQPPVGAHRQAFVRTSQIDHACTALADGTGGSFFGTCNPETSWCATIHEDGRFGITIAGQQGICVSAAAEGEECGLFPSANICRTGLNCNLENICEARIEPLPTQLDEPCYDPNSYTLFGDCIDGFCDMLGSNTCLPLRDAEAECFGSYECLSGNCDSGACSERVYCSGLN